jgi:hypothetical protein
VLQHALAPHEIDARVLERQRSGKSIDERKVSYSDAFRSTLGQARNWRFGSTPVTQPIAPFIDS